MQKTISSNKARQGPLGRPVLIVLIVALLLALGAWAGVAFWGEKIDAPAAGVTAPAAPATGTGSSGG
jgi:uncharacterized membrane protein